MRRGPKAAAEGLVWMLITVVNLTLGSPLMPDLLTYKTCMNSPPGFSPGCMANVTVNIGERAQFNCQVSLPSPLLLPPRLEQHGITKV